MPEYDAQDIYNIAQVEGVNNTGGPTIHGLSQAEGVRTGSGPTIHGLSQTEGDTRRDPGGAGGGSAFAQSIDGLSQVEGDKTRDPGGKRSGSAFAQSIDGLSQVATTDQDATLAQTGADAETAYVSATRAVQGSTTR